MKPVVFIIAFSTFLLYGCGSSLSIVSPDRKMFMNYKIGDSMQVSIGDPIIEVERASVLDAYVAQFDCQTPSIGIQAAEQIFIRKGDRFTAVAKVSHSVDEMLIRQEGPEKKSIFISIFKDGRIKQGWILGNGISPVQGSWPKEQLFVRSDIPSRGEQSFKAQLIYSGLSGNTLKASYREFSDDYARPAFSQELQYNLDESTTIAYKSIRIIVLKATNSLIDFKVLSDGGLPWLPR
jgi:hypothetical protein